MMMMQSPTNVQTASAYSSQPLQLQQQHTFASPPAQRIQSILITTDSMNDSSFAQYCYYNNISGDANPMSAAQLDDHDGNSNSNNTAVYSGWNPVQRLADVLQFIHNALILNNNSNTTTCTTGQSSASSETAQCNSRHCQQQEPIMTTMVATTERRQEHYGEEQQQQQQQQKAFLSEASEAVTEKSRFLTTTTTQSSSRFHHHHAAEAAAPTPTIGNRRVAASAREQHSDAFETRMEDADYITDLERTFPPNRFDLGYERPYYGMDE